MKDGKIPNPNTINPIAGYDIVIYCCDWRNNVFNKCK